MISSFYGFNPTYPDDWSNNILVFDFKKSCEFWIDPPPYCHLKCACFTKNFSMKKSESNGLKDNSAWTWILPSSWHLYISYVEQPNFLGPTPFLTFVDVFDTKNFSVLNYVKRLCRMQMTNNQLNHSNFKWKKIKIFSWFFAILFGPIVTDQSDF